MIVLELDRVCFYKSVEIIADLPSDRQTDFKVYDATMGCYAYAYARPYFEEFMKGLCTLIDDTDGARIALCMNSQREEIVNLVYTLIYGRRKLKALSDCKIAIFADQSFYN